MKIAYTGRASELPPTQQKKLDAKFAKIAKLLDNNLTEKEAHVILSSERHLQNAEITVNYYDQTLIGVGSDTDLFTALTSAVEKLEKQILKHRTKWRDTKRTARSGENRKLGAIPPADVIEPAPPEGAEGERVYRVAPNARKPMTLEEALLEMEGGRDYVVYTDAESDRLSILVRRRDGNFDLIEA